jgi:hypothetical protein
MTLKIKEKNLSILTFPWALSSKCYDNVKKASLYSGENSPKITKAINLPKC